MCLPMQWAGRVCMGKVEVTVELPPRESVKILVIYVRLERYGDEWNVISIGDMQLNARYATLSASELFFLKQQATAAAIRLLSQRKGTRTSAQDGG